MNSTVLVINAGSSSVKFTLFGMKKQEMVAHGEVERIGLSETRLHYQRTAGGSLSREVRVSDTREAIGRITSLLTDREHGVIGSRDVISAIGHRVVHGGEKISQPVRINDAVKEVIRECFVMAPLHNPPNLKGIEACEAHFPGVPQVAVFDTAFHTTIPEHAFLYGLPYRFYREDRIRRYGFHGTSHQYVSEKAAELLDTPPSGLRMVSCHLGNGCSITAVDRGKSIDTSMGFTPLEGLIMGTRCGDLDPAVVLYLMERQGLGPGEVDEILNRKSGLLGLAGVGSSDLRDILSAGEKGNPQAETAVRAFVYRIQRYIGAYWAVLGGLDAIIFTAGIGEHSAPIRKLVCEGLGGPEGPGVVLDPKKNETADGKSCEIQGRESRVRVLVIPTDEERAIARQTLQVLKRP